MEWLTKSASYYLSGDKAVGDNEDEEPKIDEPESMDDDNTTKDTSEAEPDEGLQERLTQVEGRSRETADNKVSAVAPEDDDDPGRLPPPPDTWPQPPLLLRPIPSAKVEVRGMRYSNSNEFETFPGTTLPGNGGGAGTADGGSVEYALPINTGIEETGKSIVVDFESPLFVGTFMMRAAGISSINDGKHHRGDGQSYFDGKKRKFQIVVRGKFKKSMRISECVTGQAFKRPAGQLPPKFLVDAFFKFMSILAPQLEASLTSERPRFLTPLAGTAHTVIARETSCKESTEEEEDEFQDCLTGEEAPTSHDDAAPDSISPIEEDLEEPQGYDETSLMRLIPDIDVGTEQKSVTSRRSVRKKAFDSISAKKAEEPYFDTETEYTFEFYQHLLILTDEEFKLDMGGIKVGLTKTLNAQPIQIVGAHRDPESGSLSHFWGFEIWHSTLYDAAISLLEKGKADEGDKEENGEEEEDDDSD